MTHKQIRDFFKSKGFETLRSGNGCTELVKQLKNKPGMSIQVNGEGLSEIISDNEKVYVGIFKSDNPGGIWPYKKVYKNFKDFIKNEKHI